MLSGRRITVPEQLPETDNTDTHYEFDDVKGYCAYLIAWITSHNDVEFDSVTEYEIVRVIMDSSEMFMKENIELISKAMK